MGRPPSPTKVTITRGDLDPSLRFFTDGEAERLVYCPTPAAASLGGRLGGAAIAVGAGDPPGLDRVLDDLGRRGVGRLLVEGGTEVLTGFLAGGLADELQLAVAPLFVGDSRAPRFVTDAAFPHGAHRRMTLVETRTVGDVVLLRYLLTQRAADRRWLGAAVELSRRCVPSAEAYSVGAVIVDAGGRVVAEGWSRDVDPRVHAEESALARVAPGDPRLAGATLYSSLEPCSVRRSRPLSCSRLIQAAGIRRVVFALREPVFLADCRGAEELEAAGVTVVEVADLAGEVRAVNAHLVS